MVQWKVSVPVMVLGIETRHEMIRWSNRPGMGYPHWWPQVFFLQIFVLQEIWRWFFFEQTQDDDEDEDDDDDDDDEDEDEEEEEDDQDAGNGINIDSTIAALLIYFRY